MQRTKPQKEYAAADKEVKAGVTKDKNNFVEELASQAEEAAGQGNLKDLYMLTRKLSGKFQQSNMPIRDPTILQSYKAVFLHCWK